MINSHSHPTNSQCPNQNEIGTFNRDLKSINMKNDLKSINMKELTLLSLERDLDRDRDLERLLDGIFSKIFKLIFDIK